MSEQENAAAIAQLTAEIGQLRTENETLKNALKQLGNSVQSAVQSDIRESEKRMTGFLGDRVESVIKKADANFNEISGLKVALWGDKDRIVGLVNEQSELVRKVEPLMRMKDQWDGNGTEENPGIPVQVTRLALTERDRVAAFKSRATFLSLGGLALFSFLATVGWTLIQRGLDASANRAQNIELRLSGLDTFDRTIAVSAGKIEKDIEWIKKSLK